MTIGASESREDVDSMWEMTINSIRETVREVLGISRGRSSKHQSDKWWNEEVKKEGEY